MKNFFLHTLNCDKTVKFKKVELDVISKKAFKEVKKTNDYEIVGKLKPKCKDKIGELTVVKTLDDNNEELQFLDVARPDERNSIFTHKVGYVHVGEKEYIQVNKMNFLLIILLGFLVGLGILLIVAYIGSAGSEPTPVKPLPDPVVEAIPEDDPYYVDPESVTDNNDEIGGGNVSLVYTLNAKKNGNDIEMMFKNPGNSSHGIVIQLYVEKYLIAQSGLINPGEQLTHLTYTADEDLLKSGVYNARYQLYFYTADSDVAVDVDAAIPDVQLAVY